MRRRSSHHSIIILRLSKGVNMYPQVMSYPEWKSKLTIRNIENLPGGLKCNYLVCIAGQDGELVAKGWKRVKPTLNQGEYLITWGKK
jgi:hypothetical protein